MDLSNYSMKFPNKVGDVYFRTGSVYSGVFPKDFAIIIPKYKQIFINPEKDIGFNGPLAFDQSWRYVGNISNLSKEEYKGILAMLASFDSESRGFAINIIENLKK